MKPIIEIKNLSKKYKIGEIQPYYTLRDSLAGLFKNPIAAVKDQLRKDEFWALKDISFSVNQGDVVGIVGRNGAGKSTLLKILSQITPPTEGEAILRGRVGSLLEVGTGFSPELTGRENIYLNGAVLGMKKAEVKSKFDEIVNFADVEKFLDTPLKHYSSGMYMRLAFAVAAHLEPEILIVDEVLAVGDSEFQKKCLGKIGDVAKEGRTVLFVSHNLLAIKNICNKAVILERGNLTMQGETETALDYYQNSQMNGGSSSTATVLIDDKGMGNGIRFSSIKVENSEGANSIQSEDGLKITLEYTSDFVEAVSGARIVITINSLSSKQTVLRLDSDILLSPIGKIFPHGKVECSVDSIGLATGVYSVDIDFHIEATRYNYVVAAAEFNVQTNLNEFKYKKDPDTTVCDRAIKYSFKSERVK